MSTFSNWFITTSAIETGNIFNSDEDYVLATNDLAFCTLDYPTVHVLFYVIMCNHIHIILRGDKEECIAFVHKFLWRVSLRISIKQEANLISKIDLDVQELQDQSSLINAGAYIIRNPYAAGLRVNGQLFNPFTYSWSSAICYFNAMLPEVYSTHDDTIKPQEEDSEMTHKQDFGLMFKQYYCLGEFSQRKCEKLLKTRIKVPENWIIDSKFMIHPMCFVDFKYVEAEIQYPIRLLGAVSSQRVETEIESRYGAINNITLSESEISAIMLKEAKDKYYVSSIRQVPQKDLLAMCGRYHRSHRVGAKTLARITGLPLSCIEKIC